MIQDDLMISDGILTRFEPAVTQKQFANSAM